MLRLTSRKRWLMAGPWPHPKTGIFYYRKATPPDLLAKSTQLSAFGIKVKREVHRSLSTKDQRPAEQLYLQVAAQQAAEWDRWRALLRDGPQTLSHKQRMGLAADHARAFLAKHEDEPFDTPAAPEPPVPDVASALAMIEAAREQMSPAEWADLVEDLGAFEKAEGTEKLRLLVRLLERYPNAFGPDLGAGIEMMFGADTSEALASRSLDVDEGTRRAVSFEMASFMGAARRGLEARQVGDYGPVEGLDRAPSFTPSPETVARSSALAGTVPPPLQGFTYPSLLYLLNHKATTNSVRPATVKGDEGYLKQFIKAVGYDDATRVTKADVRGWRDSLIAQAKPVLSPRTINNKYLSAVKATLSWGVKEFDLPFNAADGILDRREVSPSGRKEWTVEEARTILAATFRGTVRGISAPHRRAIFWAPWIAAYTGMRVSEVTQLRGIDLKNEDGVPHLLVTPEAGSTKSGKAWAVGIHKHLIEMGLLKFIRAVGDGPLFYEPLKAGHSLTNAQRRSRIQDAYQAVTDWVKDEVGMSINRPNHAWRHLFTTRSRECRMDKEARDFMMGSRSRTDAREGYGQWPPSVLDFEINKLLPFDVPDAGYRPR